jgi:hypothetical protein
MIHQWLTDWESGTVIENWEGASERRVLDGTIVHIDYWNVLKVFCVWVGGGGGGDIVVVGGWGDVELGDGCGR